MGIITLIKNIWNKLKTWFKNLFNKKNKKRKINKTTIDKTKDKNKVFINPIYNTDKDNNINSLYPKINTQELNILNKKTLFLKNKVEKGNNKKNSLLVYDINQLLKENPLYINQIDRIIQSIDDTTNLIENNHLTTNERLNILKDNISQIIDEKLNDYEKETIKKAYLEYDKVNYVIMTTLIIDDINKEIEDIKNNYSKNKYTYKENEYQINLIKKKIQEIELIYQKKEVEEELYYLKKDFYTKSKDKYDLLYNNEIFVNLNKQCDNLLNMIHKDNQEKEKTETKDKKVKKIEQKQIEQKKKQEHDEKDEDENHEQVENIMKRFLDLNLAHILLIKREKERIIPINKQDFINQINSSFIEFEVGDIHNFIFERNKQKLEIVKLYNDLSLNISLLTKSDYYPLEHINIPLIDIAQITLNKQLEINNLIQNRFNEQLNKNTSFINSFNKLNYIIEKEQEKLNPKKKDKVLIK